MPDAHLRQDRFTYSTSGPFTKNKKRILKFKETRDSKYVFQNKLDKACFYHDMTYGDFKDLVRRTASEKVLYDKAFNIAENPKHDGYECGLPSMVYKVLNNSSAGAIKSKIRSNQELAKELHKPIIKKFKRQKVYSNFKAIFGVLI